MLAMAMDGGETEAAKPGALVRAVALAFVVTGMLVAGALLLVGRADWWRGFAAATIVSLMAGVATVPIIAWALRIGASRPDLAAGAFFVAAAVRAGVALGRWARNRAGPS